MFLNRTDYQQTEAVSSYGEVRVNAPPTSYASIGSVAIAVLLWSLARDWKI